MKVNYLAVLMIVAIIIFGVAIYFFITGGKDNVLKKNINKILNINQNSKDNNNNPDGSLNNYNPQKNQASGSGGSEGGGSGGSGGGGGGGSSGGINNETNKTKILPSDINTKPCGIYYEEYEVCRGSCIEGHCTQDGRSCYCKL